MVLEVSEKFNDMIALDYKEQAPVRSRTHQIWLAAMNDLMDLTISMGSVGDLLYTKAKIEGSNPCKAYWMAMGGEGERPECI